MTDIGVQGWSYRWDEDDVPNIPKELGGAFPFLHCISVGD